MTDGDGFYEDLSEDYDRFVDWDARLAFEMPFLRERLGQAQAKSVVDVACGTGHHAIAFARAGLRVTAADSSEAMIRRAKANATAAGVSVDARTLGFGQLADKLAGGYDAITCLGNSIPHLLTASELSRAFADMAKVLRPGGLLVLQLRNFDRVLAQRDRFMAPESHAMAEEEWLFFRFYDMDGQSLRFNMVRLSRKGDEDWRVRLQHTQLYAWRRQQLVTSLGENGFDGIAAYGSFRGEPFDVETSADLVLTAQLG